MLDLLQKGDNAKLITLGNYTPDREDRKVIVTKKNKKTICIGDQKFCVETGREVSPQFKKSPVTFLLTNWTDVDENKLQQKKLNSRLEAIISRIQNFEGDLNEKLISEMESLVDKLL